MLLLLKELIAIECSWIRSDRTRLYTFKTRNNGDFDIIHKVGHGTHYDNVFVKPIIQQLWETSLNNHEHVINLYTFAEEVEKYYVTKNK